MVYKWCIFLRVNIKTTCFGRIWPSSDFMSIHVSIVRLKPDGTRWRTEGEVKGKLANGVGSQSPSHRFTLPRNLVYPALLPLMRTPRLPVVDWTDAPADLNGLVRFAERRKLVSACVPSHFKRSISYKPTGQQNVYRTRGRCTDCFHLRQRGKKA